jgi:DNA-binding MarR family transcriptional regulator
VDHSAYTALVWPKVPTLARRMKVTVRTVQRALEELAAEGWIGTPFGDAGGAREGVVYHLHPDGRACLFCVAAARTINQRTQLPVNVSTGDKKSPLLNTTDDKLTPVTGDISSPVSKPTGDILAATGDIFDSAYKERTSLRNLSKESSSTTAPSDEPPEEFFELMSHEIDLDDGVWRRIWKEARAIVPDATPEEIRFFFRDKARQVFRNRRLENPTGVILSSVDQWFTRRRVLQRRSEAQKAALELAMMEEKLRTISSPLPATNKVLEPEPQSRRSEAVPAADVRALEAQIEAAARNKVW